MSCSYTRDQFLGCLLGKAVADALGAPYEGLPPDLVFKMGPGDKIVRHASGDTLYYTDDTQMAIGVAETLVEFGRIDEEGLRKAFAENYDPNRGYGQGARRIIEAFRDGGDGRELARTLFPGGSLGNGAAMRVAPVGLMYAHDLDRLADEAERSAMPTHIHPIGVDGARLVALAVALAGRQTQFDRDDFYAELHARAKTEEFQWQLTTARQLPPEASLSGFGNSLEAHRSVMTAIACFANSPDSYTDAVGRAIGQGNDTDTLAAIAGAISGARLGRAGIPDHLVEALEDNVKGRGYLETLASRLFEASEKLR